MSDDKQERYRLAVEAKYLKKVVFGYDMLAADLLWLRFVQGMDAPVVDRKQKGWLYNLLDGVVSLDERFRLAYGAGGTWLSVIRRDVDGATDILERALVKFPDNWGIHGKLIFHHVYETGDLTRAHAIAQMATKLSGSPRYIGFLAATLAAKRFDHISGIRLLEQLANEAKDEVLKEEYIKRRNELVVQRDCVELEKILNKNYSKKWPSTWGELISKKLLRGSPVGPDGTAYVIQQETRKVVSPTITPRKTGFDSDIKSAPPKAPK